MDVNEYLVECLVRERLAEAQATAIPSWHLSSLPRRRPVRVALGRALIRLGRWILGQVDEHAGELRRLAESDGSSGS